MTERFERFSYALSEISRCWHKIAAQEMERYGLKGPHSVCLLHMYRHPEGITAARLAQECSRDKADVSRMVTAMEQKGMLHRKGTSYRALLVLTEKGCQAAEHVQKRAVLAAELGGKDISDARREEFYQMLESVMENLREISQDGLPKA